MDVMAKIEAWWGSIVDRLRMGSWFLATVGLAGAVYLVAPVQLEVALWKLLLLSGAAYLAYWIDRTVFPYARPHELLGPLYRNVELLAAAAMLRRAIIIAAVVLGAALAV